MNTGVISGVRVSHDSADLDAIEAARVGDPSAAVETLVSQSGVEEAFVMRTCHRVEAYVVADDEETAREAVRSVLDERTTAGAVTMSHAESLHHLLRVGAGLESLVLGEDQVLGQLRDAYETARAAGGIGTVLSTAITKAIHVGERARTETEINEGVVSLGSAAVRLAEREASLDGAVGLVVGAGEMGRLAAKSLATTGVADLVIANRTPERAERVADDLPRDATGTGLDDLSGAVARADVVVTATDSTTPILHDGHFEGAGETLVVDLAQPRDVDPTATGAGVSVFDIDDLEAVTDTTRERRRAAAETVEEMVEAEFERLLAQYKRERADEVIGAMYESAERVKNREVSTALTRLDAAGGLTDAQRDIVESLADSLVSQLMAAPTKSLRDAAENDDWETILTALDLFDPAFDTPPAGAFLDAERADGVDAPIEGVTEDD